jgi:hypothetical protein
MRRARVMCDEHDVPAGGPEPRREPAAVADVARCPVCRAPLQAVVGRRGPFIRCLCPPRGRRGCARSAARR